MRFRNARLRTKITSLLLSLVALWAFAAWVTLREGVNLLWVSTVNNGVAQPIDALQPELQHERQLSMIRIGYPGPQQRAALDAQRARTDRAIAKFQRLARGSGVKLAQSPTLKSAINTALAQFAGLRATRASIDSGLADRSVAAGAYSDAIESVFHVDDSLATLDDKGFARDVQTMVQLNRAREVLSQEDALVSGALTVRRFTNNDYLEFVQISGAQRYALSQVANELKDVDHTSYELVTNGSAVTRFRTVEKNVLNRSRPRKAPPITQAQWRSVADPALSQLSQAVFGGGDRLVKRAEPIAVGVIVRLALAGGLGLIAVITSIIVSITTTRALMRQLEKLRTAARELADQRLPSVVARLGQGEKVDVAKEAPPLAFGNDEVGQVGHAFNSVQTTAIHTAVEQAELRRSFRDILLSLARRSQALVHRQLTLLDEMERREEEAKELEDLFRVDHLATRMRRNAENLIVLSGSTPARGWRRPVPMIDVVRSAVAEVEDYTRVTVTSAMDEVALSGRAVGDIVHLLAELIENAVSFSPPYTQAQVSGRRVAHGYAVEIEDRGLGMTDELLEAINQRVRKTPEFNLGSSVHLGLYVVGRLADRYDVRVSLKHSSYGGTTAVVVIPRDLIVETDEAETTGPATVKRPVAQSLPVAVGATAASTIASYRDAPARVEEPPREPAEPADAPVETNVGTFARNVQALPQRRRQPEPAPDEEAGGEPTDPPESAHTPGGLPVRVPQASIAPPLRSDGPRPEQDEEDIGRTPEEIRRSIGGLQTGTRRGRSDAAKTEPGRPSHLDSPADDKA